MAPLVAYPDSRILVGGVERMVTESFAGSLRHCGYRNVLPLADVTRLGDAFAGLDPDLVVLGATPGGGDLPAALAELGRGRLEEHPVMVVVDGTSPKLMRDLLSIGVSEYVAAPFEIDKALWRASALIHTGRSLRSARKGMRRLETQLAEMRRRLEQEQAAGLARLARVIDYADDELSQHGRRVAALAGAIALEMGLSRERVADLRRAARLHDLGKVVVPDAILETPGPLNHAQSQMMQAHTNVGALLLSGGMSRLARLAELIAWAHHERWDGAGYPRGLAGESIPLEARIVAVADAFDAMTSARPYRCAIPAAEALQEVREAAGAQFDPTVVAAFLRVQACC